MAITIDDFEKVWASQSPLTPYEFSESNYKEGWNFIGGTPPSRQMWDFLQKNNDEKMQYLLNHFDNYLPLSGGTLTGMLVREGVFVQNIKDNSYIRFNGGAGNSKGAELFLNGKDYASYPGYFRLIAKDGVNSPELQGRPDGTLTWDGQPLLPVGIVQAFAGTTIPTGWLLCDGSAVSRTDYAALFAVIGTTYGAGNGSTTFNLPDLTDKFVQGSSTSGTTKAAGLPNIKGTLKSRPKSANDTVHGGAVTGASGAFSVTFKGDGVGEYGLADVSPSYNNDLTTFDASRSSSIYGNSTTVQPPALTMRYIIKY